MACGRNDFLSLSLRRGCFLLSIMDNSLFSDLLSTTVSKDSNLCKASFLNDIVQYVNVAGSDAAAQTHSSKENGAGNHTLIEYLQHLAAHDKGSQLPQKIVCSSQSESERRGEWRVPE